VAIPNIIINHISPFTSAFEFHLTAEGLAAIVKNLVQRDGIGVILEIEGAGFIGSFTRGTAKFLTRAQTSPGPGPFSIRTQGPQRIANSRADGLCEAGESAQRVYFVCMKK
jgi:hypothetical protein